MANGKHYYLDTRKKWHRIQLPDHVIGSGAAGHVYPISDDKVAKIYNNNLADDKKSDLFERIIIMAFKFQRLATLQDLPLAWPLGPVVASQSERGNELKSEEPIDEEEFCGFVMPRVHNFYSLEDVIASRKLDSTPVSGQDRIRIARRIAETLAICHDAKFIIGDINMRNIVVSANTLLPTIIDCDSFQFRSKKKEFTPDLGTIDFSSPDLLRRVTQNNNKFAGLSRTKDDDCHALAVLIFKILMNGRHPYDSADGQPHIDDLKRAIIARDFPYSAGSKSKPPTAEEAERYGLLDEEVRGLFEKSLFLGLPVAPADWVAPLNRFAAGPEGGAITPPIEAEPVPMPAAEERRSLVPLVVILLIVAVLILFAVLSGGMR
jgi:DNA-binding helix-hairpin-helix protein with protein kinase domain